MKNPLNKISIYLAGVILVFSTGIAVAENIMEELVVTAQKREQNAQDVGIAITAMSGEQMEALGYSNAQQVTAMAPGVSTIQPNGEANYAIAIRGVANSDFTTNVESPVALYVDEVYISQMSGAGFMLFDMERVEILRGPQGTLYGRNATGGLAHYLTRKPSPDPDGYVKLTYGAYGQQKLELAAGGALGGGDTLSGRISAISHKNDGYITNECPGSADGSEVFGDCHGAKDLNNANDFAYRAQFLLEPNDQFSLLFNLRKSRSDIDTGFFEHVTTVADDNGIPHLRPGTPNPGLGYTEVDGNSNPYKGSWDRPGFNDLETEGQSVTMKWFGDNVNWVYIADTSQVTRAYIEDSDASPLELFNFYLNTDADQQSHELRLEGSDDRTNWVAGLYYLSLDIDDNNGAVTHGFAVAPEDVGGFGLAECGEGESPAVDGCVNKGGIHNPYTRKLKSTSLFAQFETAINDEFSLIIGSRFIRDQQDFKYESHATDYPNFYNRRYLNDITSVANFVEAIAGTAAYEKSSSDSVWAHKIQVDYRPETDMLYYASFNRGVKSGGFNAPIFPYATTGLNYDDATLTYSPEILDAFEVGFKASFADGTMVLNGSLYSYDYRDYQAFQIVGVDTLIRNRDAESQGFELEYRMYPSDELFILLGVALNDMEVQLENGLTTTSVQSPEVNFNGLVRYEMPLGVGTLALSGSVEYRSEHFFSLAATGPVRENGYALVNAGAIYTVSPQLQFFANINNVTDEEYLVQTFELSGFFGMTEQYYGKPQWWDVGLKYEF